MTRTVVEVGPARIRGPGGVDGDAAAAALECIDDELALVEDRAVPVRDLWCDVLRAALGPSVDTAVLLVPGWWSVSRIELVRDAAHDVVSEVIVESRAAALCSVGHRNLVEISPECVVVYRDGVPLRAVPRTTASEVVAAVAGAVGSPDEVIVDSQHGDDLAVFLADHLRSAGGAAVLATTELVRAAAGSRSPVPAEPRVRSRRRLSPDRRVGAVLAGAAVCGTTVIVGVADGTATEGPAPADIPTALLVEGRVGVRVPALWQVRRIRTGPGSDRVQVISPDDPHTALHITQSPRPNGQTDQAAAETILASLTHQPPGVFDEFDAADRIAGRSVISYREARAGHRIEWVIILDDTVRIAVGCQAAPGRVDAVREACDAAVRSAHAVF